MFSEADKYWTSRSCELQFHCLRQKWSSIMFSEADKYWTSRSCELQFHCLRLFTFTFFLLDFCEAERDVENFFHNQRGQQPVICITIMLPRPFLLTIMQAVIIFMYQHGDEVNQGKKGTNKVVTREKPTFPSTFSSSWKAHLA